MYKYISFLILFYSCFGTLAQGNKSEIDATIKSIIENFDNQNETVDSLISYASKYLKSNSSITWTVSSAALEIAKDIEYTKGEAVAHYYLGTSQVYEKYDIAIDHLHKCKMLSIEIGDLSLRANTLLSISAVYHGMHQFEKAIMATKEAEQIARQIDEKKILSRVHTNLASYYYEQDTIDLALKHSKIALDLKKELKDSYGVRLNYLNLGIILCENDSTLEQGIAYLKKARKLSVRDPVMINDIMANMVWAYSSKGNYAESLSYLDSAILGNDTIDNNYTRIAIHRLGKELYLDLNDFENAFIHAKIEYELDNELRGKEMEAKVQLLELENQNFENQKRILILEKKETEANLKFAYAAVLSALLLILLGVLFRNYKLKNKLLDDLKIKQAVIKEKSNLLEIKNKEIEQFAYVAGHDLKAPLNTIISSINVIKEEINLKLNSQSRQVAEFITSSANRMKSMIESLLEHGRLGKEIEFELVDMNELLKDLLQDIQQMIVESGALIDISYLPKVKGSRVELSLLFQNLITNAIKFSKKNEVPKISVSYRSLKNAKRYEFSVRDNGIGIPESYRDKIFNLFERAHGSSFEGSGIGLAHCEKIVKLHKGTIWFDSIEEEGTTFYFILPMKGWDYTEFDNEIARPKRKRLNLNSVSL